MSSSSNGWSEPHIRPSVASASNNGWPKLLNTSLICVCDKQLLAKALIYVPHLCLRATTAGLSLYIRPSYINIYASNNDWPEPLYTSLIYIYASNNDWPEPLYSSLIYVCEQQRLAWAFIYVHHLCLWARTAGLSLYIRPSFVSASNNGWPEPLYTSLIYICEQQRLAWAFIYVPHIYMRATTTGLSLYIRPSFMSASNNDWPEPLYTSIICVCEQERLAWAFIYVHHLCLWVTTAGLSLYIRPSYIYASNNDWPEPLYTSLIYICEQQRLAWALLFVPHLCQRATTTGLSLYIRPSFVSASNNDWPEPCYSSLIYVIEQQRLAWAFIYVHHLCLRATTTGLSLYIRPSVMSASNNDWPEPLYTSIICVCE